MSKNIITGLDIGSSAVRLVVTEAGRPGELPRVIAQVKKESRGLRRGYINNFEETVQNLRDARAEAERQAKTKIRNVILGIGGVTLEARAAEGQVAVARADLEIGETDIERARAAAEAALGNGANRHILHSVPLSCKIDGKKIPGRPEGLRGTKLELKVLFIYCLTQHLSDLVRAAEQAGFTVDETVAAPIAASLVTLSVTQKAAGCVLANIGSQTISLVTFEEGQPVALSVLPVGSGDITNDIALGLRLPLEEAERLKLDPMSALHIKRKLDEIVDARLVEMFEMVDAHLKKIGRSGLLPAGIIMVGGGAGAPEMERVAKDELRLPVKIFNPLDESRLKNQVRDAGWVVAYGLCLTGLETDNHHSWFRDLKQTIGRVGSNFRDLLWP